MLRSLRKTLRRTIGSVDEHTMERLLGMAVGLSQVGPAAQSPLFHRMLRRVGVLERLPEEWPAPPVLEDLPWGSSNLLDEVGTPPNYKGFDGACPQEPILYPEFPPPVLNIGKEDHLDHVKSNVTRYLGQISRHTIPFALQSLRGPRLKPIDDELFTNILSECCFGQYINPKLDPIDLQSFSVDLKGQEVERFAKVDLTAMGKVDTIEGVHAEGTVTLLHRNHQGSYKAIAIRVGDQVVRPEDGGRWELARYFVLQGLQTLHVYLFHPRVHFPLDSINALSRMLLPKGHMLYKLLEPHTHYTLGLHRSVMHHKRSVAHNSQREIYSPFPSTTEGTHQLVIFGQKGIPGNSSYPSYAFSDGLCGEHTAYGRYRSEWFQVFFELAQQVCALIPPRDEYVERWANEIAEWVPGFPNGQEIFEGDNLPRAAASYMAMVSVYHSADHSCYANIPLDVMPMRMRKPFSQQKKSEPLNLKKLLAPEDAFRQRLFHVMFMKPVVRRSLADIRYHFQNSQARAALKQFWAGVEQLDRRWNDSPFPQSNQIATSLQY